MDETYSSAGLYHKLHVVQRCIVTIKSEYSVVLCVIYFHVCDLQAVRDGHPDGGVGHHRDDGDFERLGHHVETALCGNVEQAD